jgi:hypothetical protein
LDLQQVSGEFVVLCFLLGNGGMHAIGFLIEWVTM